MICAHINPWSTCRSGVSVHVHYWQKRVRDVIRITFYEKPWRYHGECCASIGPAAKTLGACGPSGFGLGTSLGTTFTMVPPRLFQIMSHCSSSAILLHSHNLLYLHIHLQLHLHPKLRIYIATKGGKIVLFMYIFLYDYFYWLEDAQGDKFPSY